MKTIDFDSQKRLITLLLIFLLTNILSIKLFQKIDSKNVIIYGEEYISIEDILKNSSLEFPIRLIHIKTKLHEKELKKNLSLKNIAISRRLLPQGLRIDVKARVPVAFAEKEEKGIKIKGFVDEEGYFIKEELIEDQVINPLIIKVRGWRREYKSLISKIIKSYKINSNDLESIKITFDGFVILNDKKLGEIILGHKSQNIDVQLDIIFNIKKQLDLQKIVKKIKSLDLRDPINPRLKVFIP